MDRNDVPLDAVAEDFTPPRPHEPPAELPALLPETAWRPPSGWWVALYAALLLALVLWPARGPFAQVVRSALIVILALGYPDTTRGRFQPHPSYWWAVLWCIGLLLATQLPGALVAVVILLAGGALADPAAGFALKASDPTVSFAIGASVLVAHALIIAFSLLCLRLIAGRAWMSQVALRPPSATHALLVVLVVPAFILLGNGAYQFLRHVAEVPTMTELMRPLLPGGTGHSPSPGFDMEELERLFGSWPLPLAVFLIGVMPGISEELWCRAYLGRGLVGQHGYVLGVLRTSLLFGLIHGDPAQGTMAMLMGALLHYLYLTTRSLLAPMLLHFLNNGLAVTLPRLEAIKHLDPEKGGAPWHLFMSAGLLLAAVCWALYDSRARLQTPAGEREWVPAWAGVACPPPGSATRVVAPWPSWLSAVAVAWGVAALTASLWVALAR